MSDKGSCQLSAETFFVVSLSRCFEITSKRATKVLVNYPPKADIMPN